MGMASRRGSAFRPASRSRPWPAGQVQVEQDQGGPGRVGELVGLVQEPHRLLAVGRDVQFGRHRGLAERFADQRCVAGVVFDRQDGDGLTAGSASHPGRHCAGSLLPAAGLVMPLFLACLGGRIWPVARPRPRVACPAGRKGGVLWGMIWLWTANGTRVLSRRGRSWS